MADFNIRADSVDVEQIMKQIRARIREKRGVDYTEEEVRALANVKLETFLDPSKVRSDLLAQYRRRRKDRPYEPFVTSPPENYEFEDHTVFGSSRGLTGRLIVLARKLLNPLLKLMINPNPIIQAIHKQSAMNAHVAEQFDQLVRQLNDREKERLAVLAIRDQLDDLYYEVLHNLVVEMTRLGIEVKNLKMRVESLASRLDFDERRSRALEGAVQYRPGAIRPPSAQTEAPAESGGAQPAAERQRSRRRRRRRGGRGRTMGTAPPAATAPQDEVREPELTPAQEVESRGESETETATAEDRGPESQDS